MATLKELLKEQSNIKEELQRMETSDETTEENDGNYRDTLVERWQELEADIKPIVERMTKVRAITRAAQDESNLERPDGGTGNGNGGDAKRGTRGAPDFWGQSGKSPYEDLDMVRSHMVATPELRGRALDAIELEAKRANLTGDCAENATQLVQRNLGKEGRGIAEHLLTTGSDEYQEAFAAYLEKPQANATRAALSLTQANGGYLLPFVLDYQVA